MKKHAGSLDTKSWQAVAFLHKCGCFSAWPLISEVYFRHALVPKVPYSVLLHLRLTNCTLSHNTLSAFNYCLELSGLRVTHSIGSLSGCVSAECVHVRVSRLNVQNVLCITTGVLKEVLNSTALFPPCSSRITHPWPATTSAPRTCFSSANDLQRASGKAPGMCWSCDCECLI